MIIDWLDEIAEFTVSRGKLFALLTSLPIYFMIGAISFVAISIIPYLVVASFFQITPWVMFGGAVGCGAGISIACTILIVLAA